MSENTISIYEGMFLMPQSATADLQAASDHVLGLLAKVDAEVIAFRKWDDRRLAYEIKGNKRGLFFLCYFKLAGTSIQPLERSLLLSENVLRFLITRADHLSLEQIESVEGRSELADEIKVRAEQGAEEVAATVRATTKAEREAKDDGDTATSQEAAEPAPADAPAEEEPAAG